MVIKSDKREVIGKEAVNLAIAGILAVFSDLYLTLPMYIRGGINEKSKKNSF